MTLRDPDHIPPGPGEPQRRPLATTSVVIYATLVLLAITVPRGLVNWCKNFEPNALQEIVAPRRGDDPVAVASHRSGLALSPGA